MHALISRMLKTINTESSSDRPLCCFGVFFHESQTATGRDKVRKKKKRTFVSGKI